MAKPGAAMDRIWCFSERNLMREKVVSSSDPYFNVRGDFSMEITVMPLFKIFSVFWLIAINPLLL